MASIGVRMEATTQEALHSDMNVQRSEKCRNVYRANTVSDALEKFYLFSHEITFRYPNITSFV